MPSENKVVVTRRKLAIAIASIALICCLGSGTLVYVVAQSWTGATFTISSGVYPGAPSSTIYTDGSTYFAKDAYGAISSSTDCSSLVQTAVTAGTTVHFKDGLFPIHGITLHNFLTISGEYTKSQGEGGGGTTLSLDSNSDMFIYSVASPFSNYGKNIQFNNLNFAGNNKNGHFLSVTNVHSGTIRDCAINGFLNGAIKAETCWEWTINNCFISFNGNHTLPYDSAAIVLKNGEDAGEECNGWRISDTTFDTTYAAAIYSDTSGASTFKYNQINFGPNNLIHGADTSVARPNCYTIYGNFHDSNFFQTVFVYSEQGFIYFDTLSTKNSVANCNFENAKTYMIYLAAMGSSFFRLDSNYFYYGGSGETASGISNAVVYALGVYKITSGDNQIELANASTPVLIYGAAQVLDSGYTLSFSGGFYHIPVIDNNGFVSVTGAVSEKWCPYDLEGQTASTISVYPYGAYAGGDWHIGTTNSTGFNFEFTNQPNAATWYIKYSVSYEPNTS